MYDAESQALSVNTQKPIIPEPQPPKPYQADTSDLSVTSSTQPTPAQENVSQSPASEIVQPPVTEPQADPLTTIKEKLAELDRQRTEVDSPQNRKIRRLQEAYFREQFALQPDEVLRKLAEEHQTFRDLYIKEKGKEFSVDAQGNPVDPLVVIDKQVALFKELLEASAQHMSEEERERFLKTRLTPNVAAKRRTLMRQFAKSSPTQAEALTEKNNYLQKIVTSGSDTPASEVEPVVNTNGDSEQVSPEIKIDEVVPSLQPEVVTQPPTETQIPQRTEQETNEIASSLLGRVGVKLDQSNKSRAHTLVLENMLLGNELPDQKTQSEAPQAAATDQATFRTEEVSPVEDRPSEPADVISVLGTPVPDSAPESTDEVKGNLARRPARTRR